MDVTEFYGRDEVHWNQALFVHFVVVGGEGELGVCPGPPGTWDFDFLGVNVVTLGLHEAPESTDWIRFGVELVLPFVMGGIHLNLGQLVDSLAGLATFDPAEDDRATEIKRERRREEALRADASHPPLRSQD